MPPLTQIALPTGWSEAVEWFALPDNATRRMLNFTNRSGKIVGRRGPRFLDTGATGGTAPMQQAPYIGVSTASDGRMYGIAQSRDDGRLFVSDFTTRWPRYGPTRQVQHMTSGADDYPFDYEQYNGYLYIANPKGYTLKLPLSGTVGGMPSASRCGLSPPAAGTIVAASGTTGATANPEGTFRYAVTFYSDTAESGLFGTSDPITVSTPRRITLGTLPLYPAVGARFRQDVNGRYVYRSGDIVTDWKRIGTVVGITVPTFTDNVAVLSEGETKDIEQHLHAPDFSCLKYHADRLYGANCVAHNMDWPSANQPVIPNRLYISGFNEPEYWPAVTNTPATDGGWIDVGTATDPVIALESYAGQLHIFKRDSVWVLSGDSFSTYSLVLFVSDDGLGAPGSLVSAGGMLIWMGANGNFYTLNGSDRQPLPKPFGPDTEIYVDPYFHSPQAYFADGRYWIWYEKIGEQQTSASGDRRLHNALCYDFVTQGWTKHHIHHSATATGIRDAYTASPAGFVVGKMPTNPASYLNGETATERSDVWVLSRSGLWGFTEWDPDGDGYGGTAPDTTYRELRTKPKIYADGQFRIRPRRIFLQVDIGTQASGATMGAGIASYDGSTFTEYWKQVGITESGLLRCAFPMGQTGATAMGALNNASAILRFTGTGRMEIKSIAMEATVSRPVFR